MNKQDNSNKEPAIKRDSRDLIEFLQDTRNRDMLFNNYIGVALSAYMNGVADAAKGFRAANPA